jgi:uncharacterized protein (DUF1778 family)
MPTTHPSSEPHTHAVNLRVRTETRSLIDRAAASQGKSRSDFMIDAARRAAEDALLDQALVRMDRKAYDYFLDVLDRAPGKGFKRLMQAEKPWA